MIRKIRGMLAAALIMSASATAQMANGVPDMPAGFGIRSNGVRGGEIGKPLSLQITPYNAGKELFRNDRFTVYERINFLDSRLTSYGDAICTIDKPGTAYQRFHSRVVVVFNIAHDRRITEDMLWDEVRPVLSDVIHPEICPQANMITAHVYAKNWDRTAAGQIYRPEFAPMPVVNLAPKQPLTDFEKSSNLDKRNNAAYHIIQEIVSEGILVAHFQYKVDGYHGCDKTWTMAGCTRETFAPLYWGAPDQMAVWSLNNRMLGDRSRGLSTSELEAYKTNLARIRAEYAQYTSFDGYVRGFDARMRRNERARTHNAARQKAIDDFNEMLKAGWKTIEEKGLSAIISPPGPSGPCDIRVYAGSCIEDAIYIPGYL